MISRRDFIKLVGTSAAISVRPSLGGELAAPDHRITIAPVTINLSSHLAIKTVGYNGQVPGPLLSFKENRPVTIEVVNHSNRAEVVHWHGLYVSPEVDGATEEGTPLIPPGSIKRYTFTPRPAGFRWYHTHTMAMNDLTQAQYGGQHGFLMIEPADNPARFDREFFLALHDWDGRVTGSDDRAMSPTYGAATINAKIMGFGEPLRVKAGDWVMLHLLNSSPTEIHWIALTGHTLRVVNLDGNPVPTPRDVPMLRLAPAERACVLVLMNNPGVWVLGEVRKHVQKLGMAIVVEYANNSGAPQWQQPPELIWNYEQFASAEIGPHAGEPAELIPLVIDSQFRGHGAMEAWTINGASYPHIRLPRLIAGSRYRLQFVNRSFDAHPLHLHRHSFELRQVSMPLETTRASARHDIQGITKDVILVDAETCTEVEFFANNPGATLLHCHQQNHMDLGFMAVFDYA